MPEVEMPEVDERMADFLHFEDRVLSLLARWKKFGENNPNISSSALIKSCLNEVNDGFTQALIHK